MSTNSFWTKISYTYFICAILVVTMHSINNVSPNLHINESENILWAQIIHHYTGYAVNLFFMISGLLFYRNLSFKTLVSKVQSRFKSLVIPYLCWNIIGVIFFTTIMFIPPLKELVNNENFFIHNFNDLLLGIFHYKCNVVFWFIYELIILVLLSPLILLFIKRKWSGLLFIILFYFLERQYSDYLIGIRGSGAWIYYFIGTYIGKHYFEKFSKIIFHKKISIIFIIIGIGTASILRNENIQISFFLKSILSILGTFSIWFSIDTILKFYHPWMNGLPMFIYAFHFNVCMAIGKLICLILPNYIGMETLGILLCIIITLTISIMTAKYLKQMVPTIYSILNGGR